MIDIEIFTGSDSQIKYSFDQWRRNFNDLRITHVVQSQGQRSDQITLTIFYYR